MKRSILIFCLIAVCGVCRAVAGATMTVSDVYYNEAYKRWGIDIGMENEGIPVSALQCDVAISSDFAFALSSAGDGYLTVFTDRAKVVSEIDGSAVPTHSCTTALRSNGTLRIVVYSASNTVFRGTSGNVLFVALNRRFGPDDDIVIGGEDGSGGESLNKAVNLTNQVLSYIEDDVVKSIYPDGIVNNQFLMCYDSMGNHVAMFAPLDGYSDTSVLYEDLNSVNHNLQTNVRVLDVNLLGLSTCQVLPDFIFTPLNPNALIYTLGYSDFSSNTQNRLYLYDESKEWDELYWHCDNMQLYDEGLSFEFSYDAYSAYGSRAEVKEFCFDRDFPGGQWSTVVLPISLSDEQLAAIKDGGVKVAKLAKYNEAEGTIFYEEVDKFEANTPYLIRPEETCRVFDMLTDVPLLPTDTVGVVAAGALTMHGNYDHTLISSTAESWRYGYDVSTGEFVKIGSNCVLGPFRCYLELPVAQTANAKSRIRIADGVADGIESIGADDKPCGPVYSVDGRRVLDGGRLGDVRRLPAGVYIVDGRKIVVK